MGRVVAIHQPNFFPWLGFFDKLVRSDIFIFLDHVQFSKTGGTWTNRVKLLVSGEAKWVTAPIVRNYHGVRSIHEMEFQSGQPWRNKMVKTIQNCYRKAPYFEASMAFFEPMILNPEKNISAYNTQAIRVIADRLGIAKEKIFSSSSLAHQGASNELLVSLIHSVKGNIYMCGGGAEGYQEEKIFTDHGVGLEYQAFAHPRYTQTGRDEFIPGLSIIDAVMNTGWEGVRNLLKVFP